MKKNNPYTNPQEVKELVEALQAAEQAMRDMYLSTPINPDQLLELKLAYGELWDACADYNTSYEVFSHQ